MDKKIKAIKQARVQGHFKLLPQRQRELDAYREAFLTFLDYQRAKLFGYRIFSLASIWEFPKISGAFLGVPIIRITVFWGLYWASRHSGNLPFLIKQVLRLSLSSVTRPP